MGTKSVSEQLLECLAPEWLNLVHLLLTWCHHSVPTARKTVAVMNYGTPTVHYGMITQHTAIVKTLLTCACAGSELDTARKYAGPCAHETRLPCG